MNVPEKRGTPAQGKVVKVPVPYLRISNLGKVYTLNRRKSRHCVHHREGTNEMETKERLETVQNARDIIETAQIMIDAAIKGTRMEYHYKTCGRYGFDQLLGNDGPSLHNIIREMEIEAKE